MAVADGAGLPLAIGFASASPHEITLVEATLDTGFAPAAPDRVIRDEAYDGDAGRWSDRSPGSGAATAW